MPRLFGRKKMPYKQNNGFINYRGPAELVPAQNRLGYECVECGAFLPLAYVCNAPQDSEITHACPKLLGAG